MLKYAQTCSRREGVTFELQRVLKHGVVPIGRGDMESRLPLPQSRRLCYDYIQAAMGEEALGRYKFSICEGAAMHML